MTLLDLEKQKLITDHRSLITRPRRLRATPAIRAMVRETELNARDFIYPLFVRHGTGRSEIRSMPGVYQLSVAESVREAEAAARSGVNAVILFGIPKEKDPIGLENFSEDGIVQQAIRAIKKEIPEMVVVTDVCLCEYTDHGHCGILNTGEHFHAGLPEGYVLNDPTLDVLAKVAISHAECGADIVAPSGMMDGMVTAIREGLDFAGYENLPILSYAVKYASSFYGPFRDAVGSAANLGNADKKTYQMNSANSDEALREVALDIQEGADMVMVKPGMPYLDIIRRVKDDFNVPVFAYHVSGEYAMLKAAAEKGWLNYDFAIMEVMVSFKRAGASAILTYAALDVAARIKSLNSST